MHAGIHWKRKPNKRAGKEKTAGVSFNFRLCPRIVKAISFRIISVIHTAVTSSRKKLQGTDRNYEDKTFFLIFFEK